ncbi:MAG: translation initiation factor IF-2 [Planctomycetes bacterium]|nr:translation initiation factor IF-2 [Planctomycetota bacterium]
MSDKVRIHELAKKYGMPGKDLASKLRENGFSQAKSHMSALDMIEQVQAEGLLAAIGIHPVGAAAPAPAAEAKPGGGVLLRRKKKKTAETEEPAPLPEEPAAEEAPAEPVEPTPVPTDEPAVEPPAAEEPTEAPTVAPIGQAAPKPAPAQEAAETTAPAAEVADDEPEASVEPAPAPEQAAPAAPETSPAAEVKEPEPAPAAKPAAGPAPAPKPKPAPEPKEKPRGKIIGRIDPATLAAQQPDRKREGRRILSRDDVTPDVRPTFGRTRTPGQTTGPRGKMTATELREREQGRFLRRNRQQGAQGQRRSSGGRGRHELVTDSPHAGQQVAIEAPITMGKLAEALKLKSAVVQKMAMQKQYGMFTLNTPIDEDTAVLLASEYEVELQVRHEVTAEQAHLQEIKKKRSSIEESDLVDRPPTIAFLGHVDHGKTTLVDKIRATKVADGEAGGITQHIGAYQVKTSNGHPVTIIDTPGHQAFTSMRARGAKAVDVVVLVVAGDDGVKPSTEEAINHAKAANTPLIVAVNKADKADFDFNKTSQQLMQFELVPEEFGGQTAYFKTSGMTGAGIDEMLEHIFLMAEAELGLKAHARGPASGVVLEAEVQQGRGIVAHLLIQDGTLSKGDVILAGQGYGKVKSITNDLGKQIKEAGPSTPVSVTGLDALPGVGERFDVIEALGKAKEIAQERERRARAAQLAESRSPSSELERILGKEPLVLREQINLIVRADVQGSVEVIKAEVAKLVHDEVEVKIVHSGVGTITESDVDLAEASGATLVAFHTGIPGKIRQDAERRKLTIRRYDVIYEMLDEMRDLMEGTLAPALEEEVTGHAEVKALFKSSKVGVIAGCSISDGTIHRNNRVRLLRDGAVVFTGGIGSLRREKEDVREVRDGFECGIVLDGFRDLKEGDVIEAFTVNEIKRTLV